MSYHRDVIAKEILLVLIAAKPDSLPSVVVAKAYELADAYLAEATKAAK